LEFHRYNRIHLTKELKKRNQDPTIICDLHQQQQELDAVIAGMLQQRKNLEVEQTLKRKSAATASSQLKTIREAKRKQDIPVFADIENILWSMSMVSLLLLIMVENSMLLITVSLSSMLNPFLSVSNNAYSLSHVQDNVLIL